MLKNILFAFISLCTTVTGLAQAEYFYPAAGVMNASIPTPEKFLGYAIGEQNQPTGKIKVRSTYSL